MILTISQDKMKFSLAICADLVAIVSAAAPRYNSRAFDGVLSKRQNTVNHSSSSLIVDLGYEQYTGVANQSTKLNTWKG